MAAIYVAARISRRPQARQLAQHLIEQGHTITSRWVWAKPRNPGVPETALSPKAPDHDRARFAQEDIEDLDNCDWCISLMEPDERNNSRGGRHVEFGYALGKDKRLLIVGAQETVFHHLPQVEVFDSVGHLLTRLADETERLDEPAAPAPATTMRP